MLADAEKYQKEDEMLKSKIDKRNELENSIYSIKPMVEKLPDGDQKTAALDYISNTLSWIDNSHNATYEEYEEKLKELQEKSQQLMGAMGSADAPGTADTASQPNTAPVVEEVD